METGITVPIHKRGNKPKANPDSYRAISLFPSMYKLLEKVINETILNAFTEKNSVSEYATTSVSKEKQLGSETVAFNSHEAI